MHHSDGKFSQIRFVFLSKLARDGSPGRARRGGSPRVSPARAGASRSGGGTYPGPEVPLDPPCPSLEGRSRLCTPRPPARPPNRAKRRPDCRWRLAPRDPWGPLPALIAAQTQLLDFSKRKVSSKHRFFEDPGGQGGPASSQALCFERASRKNEYGEGLGRSSPAFLWSPCSPCPTSPGTDSNPCRDLGLGSPESPFPAQTRASTISR